MRLFLAAICLSFFLVPTAQASDIEGYWLTQNERSVIKMEPCPDSDRVCGFIYWIIDGGMQIDSKNPDESKRGRPLCNLYILTDFQADGDRAWTDGRIYKADDGDMYDANMELLDAATLKVRGYVGVPLFGKSQVWTKTAPKDYPACSGT